MIAPALGLIFSGAMFSLFQTATGGWHFPSVISALAWLVTGGFTVLSLYVNRVDRINAAQEAEKRTQDQAAAAEKTRRDVQDAYDRGVAAQKAANEAKQEAAKLAPRRITAEQRAIILAFLKDKPRGPVNIISIQDADASTFANDIHAVLGEAGYSVGGMIGTAIYQPQPVGVRLNINDSTKPPPHGGPIQHALKLVGIEASGHVGMGTPRDDGIELLIGAKPR